MFKFTKVDLLTNTDIHLAHLFFPVDFKALAAAGFKFTAYAGEKGNTQYVLVESRGNIALITRLEGQDQAEAWRVSDDMPRMEDVENAIEKNLDWHYYPDGSLSYTRLKPRAFVSRLFGGAAVNIGASKRADAQAALEVAREKLAEVNTAAEVAVKAGEDVTAVHAAIDVMTAAVNTVEAGLKETENLEAEIAKDEEQVKAKPKTLTEMVAAINHSGKPSRERVAEMRALLELDTYKNDPAYATLAINMAIPFVPAVVVEVVVV